jgi:hypothetical protein
LTLFGWRRRGPNEQHFLCIGVWPDNVTAVRLSKVDASYTEVSRSNFVNGLYLLPASIDSSFLLLQGIGNNGALGPSSFIGWGLDETSLTRNSFVDTRQAMAYNLRFLIRGGTVTQPFTYLAYNNEFQNPFISRYSASDQYEYSSFHWFDDSFEPYTTLDSERLIEENFLWRNFAFDQNLFPSNSIVMLTGADSYGGPGGGRIVVDPLFRYDGTNTSSQLSTNQTRFIYYSWLHGTRWVCYDDDGNEIPCANPYLAEAGMTEQFLTSPSRLNWTLSPGATNVFGLPIDSVEIVSKQIPGLFAEITPGQSVNVISYGGDIFPNVRQPIFGANEYYFTQRDPVDFTFTPPIPGEPDFSPTNTTPLFIASVGQPMYLSGWAKKRIMNGDTNKFAYLEQFFDKAYKADANGNATTNETGILSEYGEFFPTEPGRTILKTKPDIETSEVGQAFINVISLNVDANHDGVIDRTFGGADMTSEQRPFVFWVNNDYDRGHKVDCNAVGLNCDWEEDDLGPEEVLKLPLDARFPDSHFLTNGLNAIPSQRDLEDYARLWIPNLPSVLSVLPTNYSMRLMLEGNAAIRIFRATETNGGTNYLFAASTASNQVVSSVTMHMGRLSSSSSIM